MDPRRSLIADLRRSGLTCSQVGARFGFSRQRAHQLSTKIVLSKTVQHHDPNQIFQFICDFKKLHDGNSPSLRDIGAACNISSSSAVAWVLDRLVRMGLIKRDSAGRIAVVGAVWLPPKS
jgi:hypothetical protein